MKYNYLKNCFQDPIYLFPIMLLSVAVTLTLEYIYKIGLYVSVFFLLNFNVMYVLLAKEILEIKVKKYKTLTLLVMMFIHLTVYFSLQYLLLGILSPLSFDGLVSGSYLSALYNSTLISLFNPVLSPNDIWAYTLILSQLYLTVFYVIYLVNYISLRNK